jgi:hypothetical protein
MAFSATNGYPITNQNWPIQRNEGSDDDYATAITVGDEGEIYIVGYTYSHPVGGSTDPDVFWMRYHNDGSYNPNDPNHPDWRLYKNLGDYEQGRRTNDYAYSVTIFGDYIYIVGSSNPFAANPKDYMMRLKCHRDTGVIQRHNVGGIQDYWPKYWLPLNARLWLKIV